MAYITNQWLKGVVQRNRGHSPIKVAVEPRVSSDDEWDASHQIAAHIQATREDQTYQTIYFTQQDIAAILPYLVARASADAKAQAATIVLTGLSGGELASFLEELFARRRAAKGL